jgi:hypothetical protein
LATIARDALATLSRLSQDAPRDARRVADDLAEEVRTLQAYARHAHRDASDTESQIWRAERLGYVSFDLADELTSVAAGGECSAAVARAYTFALESAGVDAGASGQECDS